MTLTTPVERVADRLARAEYRRLDMPLDIAGLKFEFPAAFLGRTGTSLDLVVIADTAFESEGRIQQKIQGLARALDGMQSRRPLTVVVTGPRPSGAAIDGLSRVCRVLSAGDAQNDDMLENALAVLLPLNLPEPKDDLTDVRNTLEHRPGEHDAITDDLVAAACDGEAAVRERLHQLIAEPFDLLGSDQEEEE
jgi:hypothetical protein